jgi:SAM-dependent methyltransferase
MSACPVCGAAGAPLLRLDRQPIYQHPVPAGVDVPVPHAVDLAWLACGDCAHAWQPSFDPKLLAAIYRSFYYTPAPDGIAVQFRRDFLAALDDSGVGRNAQVLLEVGASNGDVLAELKARSGARHAYAYEPNRDNAAVARERGLTVREEFFGAAAAQAGHEPIDFAYSRHVIEHIFDFGDFFAGMAAVTRPGANLVLETPSLDFHAQRGSVDPFHIEHIHVFGLRSLARLGARHGWGLQNSRVTSSGNLIAQFVRGAPAVEVPPPSLGGLQQFVDTRHQQLRSTFAGRPLVFWGAGSSGVVMVNILGHEPEWWTDGNPNKVGKSFVGLQRRIIAPEEALRAASTSVSEGAALLITSSFVAEILPRVRELGWKGPVHDSSGNSL